jgi:hypothetical protein
LASIRSYSGTTIPLPKRGNELECTTTTALPSESTALTIDVPLGSPGVAAATNGIEHPAVGGAGVVTGICSGHRFEKRRTVGGSRCRPCLQPAHRALGASNPLGPGEREVSGRQHAAAPADRGDDGRAYRPGEEVLATGEELVDGLGQTGQTHERARGDRAAIGVVDGSVGVLLVHQCTGLVRQLLVDGGPREPVAGEGQSRGREAFEGQAAPRGEGQVADGRGGPTERGPTSRQEPRLPRRQSVAPPLPPEPEVRAGAVDDGNEVAAQPALGGNRTVPAIAAATTAP